MLRRLAALSAAYRKALAVSTMALMGATLLSLVTPLLLREAIDNGIIGVDPRVLALCALGLAVIGTVQATADFASGFLTAKISHNVAYDLRNSVFRKLQRLGAAYHEQVHVGQLVSRTTSDVEQLREFVGDGLVQLASAALTLTGALVVLFWMNALLAGIALLAVPIAVAVLVCLVGRLGPIAQVRQDKLARVSAVLQDNLRGARLVRAFGLSRFELERGRRANEELLSASRAERRAIANSFPLLNSIALVGPVVVTIVGCVQIARGAITVGDLVAFQIYLLLVLGPVSSMGIGAHEFAEASASGRRIFEVLDATEEVRDKGNDGVVLHDADGRIEFDDVSFRYPGDVRDALSHFSYVFEPGAHVAIVGAMGSGKTSIVNLVARFYDASGGCVRVDGVDVRDISLESLRGQIGYAMQDGVLLSGSIRDNIAYGKPDASLEEVVAAARSAHIADFIEGLPKGYDTVIGERGAGLSGGQCQRLNIARTLLISPRILMLDDSTSQVDGMTDAAIMESLSGLLSGRTTISIVSRLRSALRADTVLVMDQGNLVGAGTHEELLLACRKYAELAAEQLPGDGEEIFVGAARGHPRFAQAAQHA
jgi:ATP-binding cassette subfamily B multidrug efflux pump